MVDAENDVVLNGTLTASGQGATYAGGGGAGGSVYLRCRRLIGTGRIEARGGDGGSDHNGGGGGGGRIAIWRLNDAQWSGTLSYPASVSGGARGDTVAGTGTLVWQVLPVKLGAVFVVR